MLAASGGLAHFTLRTGRAAGGELQSPGLWLACGSRLTIMLLTTSFLLLGGLLHNQQQAECNYLI
jgi:hypothetical protein